MLLRGMIAAMAQSRRTHKGERDQLLPPLSDVVYSRIAALKAAHNTSFSQIAADLLCIVTGHPDLVRDLRQTVIPELRLSASPANRASHKGTRNVKVRVPRVVYVDICHLATEHRTEPRHISADLLAIAAGHPELVRHLSEEVLQLAITA